MSMLRSWPFYLVLLISAIAVAADQPPPAKAPAKPAPKPDENILREQTIYVPYSKLPKVFEQPGRGVFLPYEEFQKLWEQARAALAKPPEVKPPVAALLTEINSEAAVGDEVVTVTANLKIELLTEGWHEVPLRLGDAAILSARQGDQPARIIAKPDVGYVLLLQKKTPAPEQVTVTLQYSKAFTKSPGQNVVSFQAPQAPVNQWRIRVPQAGVKVNVQPLVAATEEPPPAAPAGGKPAPKPKPETVVMAFVGAAPSVQIDWTPKAEGAMGLTALATVQTEQQVSIDEGVVRTTDPAGVHNQPRGTGRIGHRGARRSKGAERLRPERQGMEGRTSRGLEQDHGPAVPAGQGDPAAAGRNGEIQRRPAAEADCGAGRAGLGCGPPAGRRRGASRSDVAGRAGHARRLAATGRQRTATDAGQHAPGTSRSAFRPCPSS